MAHENESFLFCNYAGVEWLALLMLVTTPAVNKGKKIQPASCQLLLRTRSEDHGRVAECAKAILQGMGHPLCIGHVMHAVSFE
jgi:hypothetical protein